MLYKCRDRRHFESDKTQIKKADLHFRCFGGFGVIEKKRFFADYVQQELSRLVMGPSIASGDSIRDLSALHIQTR